MKKKLVELFIQIIPVMIGVYLGFVVSNWAQNKDRNDKKKILTENIFIEIENNKKLVENVIAYHQLLRDSSQYYLSFSEPIKTIRFFKGVNTLILTNNSFETGIQTGIINNLPISLIQNLNSIDASQKSYEAFCNLMLSGLMSLDVDENNKSVRKILRFLSTSMNDVIFKEKQLLKKYNLVLKQLEDEKIRM